MKDFLKRNFLNIILIILLGLFTYYAIVKRAPINMDEFSQYHPIICNHYEFNKLNIFREACGMYDLILPGTDNALPLRSYGYGGSLASLYYYPLFLVWQSPDSARMMGYIFILLQAWVLGRILKQKFAYALIGLVAFFPYYYQVIVDTGIIQFYTTATLFICYFLERWFATRKWQYIVGVGALLFLNIYSRLSFVFGVPALVVVFLYYLWQNRLSLLLYLPKLVKQGILALIVMGVPLALYFLSTSALDSSIQPILAEAGRGTHTWAQMLQPSTYLDSELLRRFFSPLEATSRGYEMQKIGVVPIIYSAILFGIPILTILVQWIQQLRKKSNVNSKVVLYMIAFIVTALFMFKSTETKHMHHAMMAYPFLVLAWGYIILDLVKRFGIVAKIFLIGLVLFNGYFYITFTSQKVLIYDEETKIKVNEILNSDYMASKYFYIAANWGTYFYQGLYGPKQQSVLYIEGSRTDKEVMDKLAEYPSKYDRQLLFIYDKQIAGSKEELLQFDSTLVECALTKGLDVWGILLPSNMEENNPCRL